MDKREDSLDWGFILFAAVVYAAYFFMAWPTIAGWFLK